jgi:hypothetical protein
VGGEVHAEADAHDEVDEGDPVQHDAPQGHEPQGSLFFKRIFKTSFVNNNENSIMIHKSQGSLF